jgi:hypothetical protein
VLSHLEALLECGEIPIAHGGFFAQTHDQRFLEVLSVVQILDVAQLGGDLGAQPPKLAFVYVGGVFAHAVRGTAGTRGVGVDRC